MPNPGDKLRSKRTGEVFQFDGTGWLNMGVVPQGAQPAPQYGQGAYQTEAGDIMAPAPKGGVKVLKQGGQAADASLKGRIAMGAGPMVQAQETMAQVERQGNPFDLSKNADNAAAKADVLATYNSLTDPKAKADFFAKNAQAIYASIKV